MFDMFRSREKSVRILLGVLLGLVALSMVTYLIPGGYGSTTGSPSVVAEIGGEPVTINEVRFNLQAIMRNKGIPPGMEDYFVPQLIQQMVTERALAYEAARLGFQVSDEEVANTIRSIIPAEVAENPQLYRDYLARQGTTVQDYENGIRKQMLLVKLRNIAAEGVIVSPQEVESEYKKRNDKIRIAYVALNPDKVKADTKVTPEEEQAYFTTHAVAFRVPAKNNYDLLIVDQDRLAQNVEVSDAELQQAYQAKIDTYRTPERVHARHILVTTTGKSKEEADKLKAKAEGLLKQVKAGGDFAAIAKANSDDPGSKEKGGDLGWFGRGQMVKNFENAAFSLKPNEISNLVPTEYGFHIVQVLEKEDARLKPLDEVKADLLTAAKRQKVVEQMQKTADQAHAELAKNPAAAEQIAQKYNLIFQKAEKIGPGAPLPLIGQSGDFDNAIKSLKKGEVSQAVQVSPTRIAMAVQTGTEPEHQAQFAEVEPEVKAKAIADKANTVLDAKKKEFADKAKQAGGDLKKLAQEMGLEYKEVPEFSRAGAVEGVGPAGYVSEAFDKPLGTVLGPSPAGTNTIVYKTIEKVDADMTKLSMERDGILDALKAKKARERNDLFEDGVVKRLIDQGKVKIYENQVRQLSSAGRG